MMRAVVIFLLFATFVNAKAIPWRDNLGQAFEEAKRTQRPLMVLVEGRYCKWCKKNTLHKEGKK